ncbi:hypothetical protein B7494_g4386 [Chlorociboria aeruginascens]|nr:hypothetical protein B7494_g4386 [Chlorociboria aeruginascens]
MALVSGPGIARGGKSSSLPMEIQLAIEPHVKYIQSLDTRRDEIEYWLTEHLRLNGLYWGLNALHLLGRPDALPRDETIDFVLSCQADNGGFGAAPGHDAHLLYTVSAVQILVMVDGLEDLDKRGKEGGRGIVAKFLADLQNRETGTFAGDEWGEEDTRFLYAALNALDLLKSLHLVDVNRAVEYIVSCANFDGGYGVSPGAESHSGQIFACLGALSIAGRIDTVDKDKLGRWLSERQVEAGGLNGRPEKKEDDTEKGGIADRPGDMVDVFHTNFGLAGLALLEYPGLEEVDAVQSLMAWVLKCCNNPSPLVAIPISMPPSLKHSTFYFVTETTRPSDPESTIVADVFESISQINELILMNIRIEATSQGATMSRSENKVPLLCSLCPKSPQFSDISHLLTHMASKSHLAHRFKLQIRGQTDIAAQEKLNDFDRWYHAFGLDTLLSERLAAKEQKKTAKERRSRGATLKTDKDLNGDDAYQPPPVYRAPVPQMHLWPTGGTKTSVPTMKNEWGENTEYEVPSDRREVPNFSQSDNFNHVLDPSLTTPVKPNTETTINSGSSTKLKGIILPGMDLFDSATPEMKRMRNQRKDGTILQQMIATSAQVEPLEVAPSPKKRRARKNALADVSTNAPRRTRAKVGDSPSKLSALSTHRRLVAGQLVANPPPTLNPLVFGRGITSDDHEEFDLTIGDMKKKRGITVFKDAPEITPEISPGRTESPLEDHRFDFGNHGLPVYPDITNSSNLVSPTPQVKLGMRNFGRDIGNSTYHQNRRADSASHVYPPQVYYEPSITNPLLGNGQGRPFDQFNYNYLNPDFKPVVPNFRASCPYGTGSNSSGKDSQYDL